jgi:hypothetical protein
MQAPRSTLYESDNLYGPQARQFYRSITESIPEKIADEWDIVDDRGLGQSAVLPQVLFVGPRTTLGWDERRCRALLGWNRPPSPQKYHQMIERSGISLIGLPLTVATSQIL